MADPDDLTDEALPAAPLPPSAAVPPPYPAPPPIAGPAGSESLPPTQATPPPPPATPAPDDAWRTPAPAAPAPEPAPKIQRIKGRDYFGRPKPPAPAPDVAAPRPPVQLSDRPFTGYDLATGVGGDAIGQPRRSPRQPEGSVALSDPSLDAERKRDSQGNLSAAPPDLPWRWEGVTPAAPAAVDDSTVPPRRPPATVPPARISRPAAPVQPPPFDPEAAAQELETRRQELQEVVPGLARASDAATGRRAIEDHFNTEYAAPEANVKVGYFNTGDYTPAVRQRRADIDRRKAATQQRYDDLLRRGAELARAQPAPPPQAIRAQPLPTPGRPARMLPDVARVAGTPIPGIDPGLAPAVAPGIAPGPRAGVPPPPPSGDFGRGAKVSLKQVPQLAQGTLALLGATGEKLFGTGGSATTLKNWG